MALGHKTELVASFQKSGSEIKLTVKAQGQEFSVANLGLLSTLLKNKH